MTPTPAAEEVRPILATTVLRTGTQRVAFVLHTEQALVTASSVDVVTTFLDGAAPGETRRATFHAWPYGTRGSYTTPLTFPQAGRWRLDISVPEGDGILRTSLPLMVAESSGVRDVGSVAPFSRNKTLAQGYALAELTSAAEPDPAFYRLTVAEAIISGKPSVVTIASPAFCVSPTCGPQVETMSALREAYQDDVNFIHVEVYDNPQEVQGDLRRARVSPVAQEWGLTSIPGWTNESWVFVIGKNGRITQRFEGYAAADELDAALQRILAPA